MLFGASLSMLYIDRDHCPRTQNNTMRERVSGPHVCHILVPWDQCTPWNAPCILVYWGAHVKALGRWMCRHIMTWYKWIQPETVNWVSCSYLATCQHTCVSLACQTQTVNQKLKSIQLFAKKLLLWILPLPNSKSICLSLHLLLINHCNPLQIYSPSLPLLLTLPEIPPSHPLSH